jgi:protein-tyrosine phosphatase
MTAELWWIPVLANGRLAILARPRGGDWLPDEVERWRKAGVEVVVCLLESTETADLELAEEQVCCERAGLRFVAHPIPDRGVPGDRVQFNSLVDEVAELVAAGRCVGIHCRAGIGRSGLVAAGVLTRQGLTASDAFRTLAAARGREVPDTAEQAAWLESSAIPRSGT